MFVDEIRYMYDINQERKLDIWAPAGPRHPTVIWFHVEDADVDGGKAPVALKEYASIDEMVLVYVPLPKPDNVTYTYSDMLTDAGRAVTFMRRWIHTVGGNEQSISIGGFGMAAHVALMLGMNQTLTPLVKNVYSCCALIDTLDIMRPANDSRTPRYDMFSPMHKTDAPYDLPRIVVMTIYKPMIYEENALFNAYLRYNLHDTYFKVFKGINYKHSREACARFVVEDLSSTKW